MKKCTIKVKPDPDQDYLDASRWVRRQLVREAYTVAAERKDQAEMDRLSRELTAINRT